MAVEATPRNVAVAERVLLDTRVPGDTLSGIDWSGRRRVAAVVSVPVLGLLIAMAATRTDVLVPVADRPVPSWMAGPLRSIGFDLPIGVAMGMIMLLFAAYVAAAHVAELVSPRVVVIAVVSFNVVVLLGPPLFSTDIFSYQMYARLFAHYHANPYTYGPNAANLDPLYPFIGEKWISTPSVYGPLFTLASGALAGASIAFSEFTFKLIAAFASLGTLTLIWRAARLRGLNPNRAIALFGLNPLVTLYGVGGGHNDLLMLLFSTGAIYALLLRRDFAGGASFVAGAAIKLTGGLLLPFALADRTDPATLGRRHRRLLMGAALTAVIILIPSFIVFGSGLLKMPGTLQTVQGEGQWQSIPGFFVNLAQINETRGITSAFGLVFAGICLWLLWRVWHGRLDWIEGAGWATFAMLATAGSLLPWYVAWLLPLVGLTASRRLWIASIGMTGIATVMTVITYLPHGIPFLQV